MNFKLAEGLSGSKLQILNDEKYEFPIVRKISPNISYNNRLKKQMEKQDFFSRELKTKTQIHVPRILNFGKIDDLFYFDMPYQFGLNYTVFFQKASKKDLDLLFLQLDNYFQFLYSHSTSSEKAQEKFLEKLFLMRNELKEYTHLIDFLIRKTKAMNFNEYLFNSCHGDLTLSNIVFCNSKISLIDFLDSFVDSILIDLIKLKQDLYYQWAYLNIKGVEEMRIVQCSLYLWNKLFLRFQEILESDASYLIDIMNLLRIVPYANKKQKNILHKLIKKTILYEKFNCSHSG